MQRLPHSSKSICIDHKQWVYCSAHGPAAGRACLCDASFPHLAGDCLKGGCIRRCQLWDQRFLMWLSLAVWPRAFSNTRASGVVLEAWV